MRHDGREHRVAADCLAVAGGWNPAIHLASHLGGRPSWDPARAAFLAVAGAVPGMRVAGAAAGDFSTHAALAGGAAMAAAALDDLGIAAAPGELPAAEDAPLRVAAFWQVEEAPGRAWLDLQNDVTVKDVALAARENFRSVEHMKRYTTLGMATDQGKTAGVAGLAVLAELTGRGIGETGTTTFRPPYTPVPIAALGAGGDGAGFAPQRFTPAHGEAARLGAPFVEAGHWYRASWFPAPGETAWQQSCDREVGWVRGAVGVCDVTTLGKIDVQGPDAAAFLDRVYANTISTLAVGRVRYGLMLREDGFVMDDGTAARLAPAQFLLTTTTAAAGEVMAHLEFCLQCLWPELDVQVVSVTEQWAQVAVAGPRSRELLNAVLAVPADTASFPFIACGAAVVAGVAGRLFRISFSGEQAYEVAVPAATARRSSRACRAWRAALGGGPYGLEALNVLRIEKGLLPTPSCTAGPPLDDLGLARMLAKARTASARPAPRAPGSPGRSASSSSAPGRSSPAGGWWPGPTCSRRARRSRRRTTRAT